MLPAELEDPVRVGAVRLLFVKVSVPVVETNVAFETAVLKAELVSTDGQTPYHVVGTWPLYIWALLLSLIHI